jgi:predicted small metal-binding protein
MSQGFSCAAAGATACGWKPEGGSEEEVVEQVAEHLREVHDVQNVTNTLAKYALAVHADGEDVQLRAEP